ncbi:Hypothetical predicted protein [Podarcis lilfordi]|uniref:Uncharacterized protein n=1 Tax=Podarcis lilfordi TaxID=74358 RepID=A0AA35LN14_9SAUR|nr:Hypothetical predicted protein [Podarcis lilfordi]
MSGPDRITTRKTAASVAAAAARRASVQGDNGGKGDKEQTHPFALQLLEFRKEMMKSMQEFTQLVRSDIEKSNLSLKEQVHRDIENSNKVLKEQFGILGDKVSNLETKVDKLEKLREEVTEVREEQKGMLGLVQGVQEKQSDLEDQVLLLQLRERDRTIRL